ncbi:MAG: electron transfer flavoprotein subunit beta/FixA family protein [candidate division NC10 bacterium]|nr:electron transfer flavoprotein subunit beta/FixA family protein [candidate division NC10 bacterium]
MKIIVCLKQVPDTAATIKVKPDGSGVETEGITYVINPYDEFALEEALRIKERLGEGEVTVITLGPPKAKEALRTALAMGADKGVHLSDPAFEGGDSYATAKALARAIQGLPYDLILCGKQAVDDDAAQVGPAMAELLGLPQACVITKLEIDANRKKAVVHRQIEGASEIMEVSLPAVFTAQKGLNEPRYPSLKGIMGAKKKEIAEHNPSSLGLSPEEVGLAGSKVKILKLSPPPSRATGKILEGEPREQASQLVKLLREEAKII